MARGWIEHDPPSQQRVVGGWLATVATVAALVLVAWCLARAWSGDLPDPLAIHWGADGAADGTATFHGTVRVTTGLGIAGIAGLLVAGAAQLDRPRLLRGVLTGTAALAALAPASLDQPPSPPKSDEMMGMRSGAAASSMPRAMTRASSR